MKWRKPRPNNDLRLEKILLRIVGMSRPNAPTDLNSDQLRAFAATVQAAAASIEGCAQRMDQLKIGLIKPKLWSSAAESAGYIVRFAAESSAALIEELSPKKAELPQDQPAKPPRLRKGQSGKK